jgi:hypothetical protein
MADSPAQEALASVGGLRRCPSLLSNGLARLALHMWGTNQLRPVFEEGVLAHQTIRRWLSVTDSNLF